MNLKDKVEATLKNYPQTRNSDVELTLFLWVTFYQEHLEWQQEGERWVVDLKMVSRLPSEDKIARFRRKFQELDMYSATDPVVLERRNREKKVKATIVTPHWSEAFQE